MTLYHSIFLNTSTPGSLAEWLNHKQPLTDKLHSLTSSAVLQLMSQRWCPSSWWDKYCLQMNSHSIFQREIIMYSHGVAYWYAKTLITKTSYEQNVPFFNRLQQESLKNLIFNNNEVKLINRSCYPIDEHCIEYHWVKKYLSNLEALIWVRLSEYSYKKSEAFYLIELLFPKLGALTG